MVTEQRQEAGISRATNWTLPYSASQFARIPWTLRRDGAIGRKGSFKKKIKILNFAFF